MNELIGKTLTLIEGATAGSDRISFVADDGSKFAMFHCQDCCESVTVNEVVGDVADLIGSPILQAEASSNHDEPPKHADSFTWTFYRITTMKGQVVIRWLGESNGYYSEGVTFAKE